VLRLTQVTHAFHVAQTTTDVAIPVHGFGIGYNDVSSAARSGPTIVKAVFGLRTLLFRSPKGVMIPLVGRGEQPSWGPLLCSGTAGEPRPRFQGHWLQ